MKRTLICLALLLCIGSVSAQTTGHQVTFTWAAPAGVTVTGYNVYRAPGSCTATFVKLTAAPQTALSYTDSGQADGAVFCYYVSSVISTGETPQSMCAMQLVTFPTAVAALTPPPPAVNRPTIQ